jgi:hypothetical protein
MIVRGKELHCRQGWGLDRWDVAIDDVVLEIRVREPDPGPGSRRVTPAPRLETRPAVAPTADSVICAWSAEPAPEAGAESSS